MTSALQNQTGRPLTSFTALSFDVYATLIDWESGIYSALEPLNARLASSHPLKDNKVSLLQTYRKWEGILEHKYPEMQYAEVLSAVYAEIAKDLGVSSESSPVSEDEKAAFGASVGNWPAFPDTVEALKRLSKRYKLIVLSNVDSRSFSGTMSGPLKEITFDAVYMAEQIGSYKPDLRNFEFLIQHAEQDLGVKKDGILHTAQALEHDHIPARKVGLKSCWIERAGANSAMGGKLAELGDAVELAYRFKTLGDMADAVDEAFEAL